MYSILVVDDNANTRRLMEIVLRQNGFEPLLASDAAQALDQMEHSHVDLVVLDIMMPGMDGYEFLQTIRECQISMPVLMISAKDAPDDKHKGFLAGADDYMVKPVDEVEMVLRIQALLRRSKIAAEQRIVVGETELDYNSFSVTRAGKTIVLPKKEFLLLFKFLSFPNKTFTRNQLMNEFWDPDSESEARTVDVHINRLRDHVRDNPDFEVVTVRGLGYKAVRRDADGEKS